LQVALDVSGTANWLRERGTAKLLGANAFGLAFMKLGFAVIIGCGISTSKESELSAAGAAFWKPRVANLFSIKLKFMINSLV
jgi:hypothetical protein